MAASCSYWWKAPVFFTISVVLAFIAISTAIHPTTNNNANPQNKSIGHQLSINASRALRRSGFHTMATFLQISPEIFLSSPNTTIFAIKDSALSNASLPPWLLRELLQYHTAPSRISMSDLLNMREGSCFRTLLHGKNVAVTRVDAKERIIEINHMLISHPDVFLEGSLAVHGVLGAFSALDPQHVNQGWGYIQSPVCDSNFSMVSDISIAKNMVPWTRIIRLLSSNGFISFAIGLHSVLDRILDDHMNLTSVTIFTPPDFAFVASPPGLLDKTVRLHILPLRFTYRELAALPYKASVRTLVPDQDLEITGGANSTQGLAVNGVEVVAPEIFMSKNFMIHGISQALDMAELPNTSR